MILIPKFRLPLHIMITNNVKYDMDFLKMSIESNNWECAFFVLARFENFINRDAQKAMKGLVQCFQTTSKYIKAKLFMTKRLLFAFNFDGFKLLVKNIKYKVTDPQLSNNMFAHSPNPLLSMLLTYEVIMLVSKQCFSLTYDCKQLNK